MDMQTGRERERKKEEKRKHSLLRIFALDLRRDARCLLGGCLYLDKILFLCCAGDNVSAGSGSIKKVIDLCNVATSKGRGRVLYAREYSRYRRER